MIKIFSKVLELVNQKHHQAIPTYSVLKKKS